MDCREDKNEACRKAGLNLRQESKPMAAECCPECHTAIMPNGFGFHHSADCKLINFNFDKDAALPSQPDIEQQEWEKAEISPQEMWDEIQDIRRLTDDDGTTGSPSNLVKGLKEKLRVSEKDLMLHKVWISGSNAQIDQLKSDLARKNDQIKSLRYALRIYGDDQNEKDIEDLLAEIGED
jgi:hypothetical protein